MPTLSPPSDFSVPDILPVDIVPVSSPPEPLGDYEPASPPAPDLQRPRSAAGGGMRRDTAPLERAMISCIMPTADRRDFVPDAIRQYLAQDYPNRELIVVDDGEDDVSDLIPPDPSIRYYRLPPGRSLGAKRNFAVEMARGDVIVHWDDDDWRSDRWVRSQVTTLLSEQADICGLDRILFYEPATRRGWRYVYDDTRPWVAGSTLCYRRDYWCANPFGDLTIGEDNAFVWSDRAQRIVLNAHADQFIATIHGANTSRKDYTGYRWQPCPAAIIEEYMHPAPPLAAQTPQRSS